MASGKMLGESEGRVAEAERRVICNMSVDGNGSSAVASEAEFTENKLK